MDMLYRAYSNPMDLMRLYINRGQFGKFVEGFLEAEQARQKEQAEKDDDLKLWMMYVQLCMHQQVEDSFGEWKKKLLTDSGKQTAGKDVDLDNNGIKAILADLFPNM